MKRSLGFRDYVWLGLTVLALLAAAGEITLRLVPSLSPIADAESRMRRLRPDRTPISRRIKRQLVAAPARYREDPYLGAVLAPSEHDTYRTPDFDWSWGTDSLGFVNHEPWPEHPDAVVLGSSLVMAPGVGMDGRFSTVLERRFGRAILNLGSPGAGTEMEDRIEQKFAEPLRPPLVIDALWLASDIDNTLEFHDWLKEEPGEAFTPYRMSYWNSHSAATPPARLARLLDHSALWRAVHLSVKALAIRQHIREAVLLPHGDTIFLSVRVQHRLALGLDRGPEPDMKDIFLEPLQRMQRRIEARGGRFLVVLLPSKEAIYGAAAYPAVMRALRQTRQGLARRGIQYLDLTDVFRAAGREPSPYYPLDIHYTRLGNQLIADAIADWIVANRAFGVPAPAHGKSAPPSTSQAGRTTRGTAASVTLRRPRTEGR